ncbi:MAG: PQQ-dependent sugar dehydrogenase, partial [Candidatus Paceibacterota bacterium]
NYGWPEIQGSTEREGMITPVANSGATVTWAPANLVFYDGRLFFTGLRGQTLYEVTLLRNGGLSPVKEHFKSEYGRLRALFLDENGDIYFGTSNKDGRGRPKAGDDKIFKVRF